MSKQYVCDFCYAAIDNVDSDGCGQEERLTPHYRVLFRIRGDGAHEHICKECLIKYLVTPEAREPILAASAVAEEDIPF